MKKISVKIIISTLCSIFRVCIRVSSLGRGYTLSKQNKDKRCIILANGPSLKEDVDKLENLPEVDYFVVNFFALSDHFMRLKPNYYVFADDAFWNSEEAMHRQAVIQRRELMKQFNRVNWEMNLFVPHKGINSPVLKNLKSNPYIKLISYNTGTFEGASRLQLFLYKKNICMPTTQNVLIPSIYLAINSGYRKIELYGADFSWTRSICVNIENLLCQIDDHFYDKENVKISPVLGYVDRPYRMHNYLNDLASMFYGCWQVRDYADALGVKILNHNKYSFIDAFDKE